MNLKSSDNNSSRAPAVPWESVDPEETQSTSDSESPAVQSLQAQSVESIDAPATAVLERREDGELAVVHPIAPALAESEDPSEFPEEDLQLAYQAQSPQPQDGGGWTIAVLCIGLSLIAACVIIPQADANRRLVYEREKLRMDLAQIQKQSEVNQEFLVKIREDPQLAQRLAQRQMKMVLQGEAVLDLQTPDAGPRSAAATASLDAEQMSPFRIVHVPPPAPLPAYQPLGGTLASLCRQPRTELYLLGGGMLMVAVGLVLGDADPKTFAKSSDPIRLVPGEIRNPNDPGAPGTN
jgi:hypothetical protein